MDSCYYYALTLPDLHDLVMGQVVEINPSFVTCELVEYHHHPAMLPINDITRKRGKNPLRVGQLHVFSVTHKDDQEHVVISKRDVRPEEAQVYKIHYQQAKKCMTIIQRLADLVQQPYEDIRRLVLDPLYESDIHPYQQMKEYRHESTRASGAPSTTLFDHLNPSMKHHLDTLIDHYIKTQEEEIKMWVEVTCYGQRGILGIKELLRSGLAIDPNITITLIASPTYCITAPNEDLMNKVIAVMSECAQSIPGSTLRIPTQPSFESDQSPPILSNRPS